MADENLDGLVLPVGLTEKQFVQQLTRMETRLAKMEQGTVARLRSNNAQIEKSFGAMSRSARANLQNVSFQLQDIFVQIQGGQGAVRALSQQLPQLLSSFGAFGIAAGVAVSALGTLVPSMFNLGKASLNTTEAVENLSKSISDYSRFLALAATSTADLNETYGEFGATVRDLSEYMARVSLAKALEDMDAAIDPLKLGIAEVLTLVESLAKTNAELATYADAPASITTPLLQAQELLQQQLAATLDELGLTEEQALRVASAIDAIKADNMADLASGAASAAAELRSMWKDGLDLPPALREAAFALDDIARIAGQAAEQEREMESVVIRIYDWLVKTWNGNPGAGWLAGEIADAGKLATALWDAARARRPSSCETWPTKWSGARSASRGRFQGSNCKFAGCFPRKSGRDAQRLRADITSDGRPPEVAPCGSGGVAPIPAAAKRCGRQRFNRRRSWHKVWQGGRDAKARRRRPLRAQTGSDQSAARVWVPRAGAGDLGSAHLFGHGVPSLYRTA